MTLGFNREGSYDAQTMPRPHQKRDGKPHGRRPKAGERSGRPTTPRRPKPARATAPPSVDGESSEQRSHGDRLQKVLAAAGIASRRECEAMILEGRVQVDGQVVSELGARVDRSQQEIKLDGEPLPRPKLRYFAVNKPVGVVCTARDPAGRPRVTDLLPPGVGRMFNVGRLDLTSEGLILVTNDGELANRLTHPRHGVEKVYEVQVAGSPEPDVLAQLHRGVHLAEGYVRAVNVRVKSRKKNSTLLEMVLDEGRNREIRRLLARVGHKVQRLTRIAVGPIRLGELPRGAVRPLSREEIQRLRAATLQGPRAEGMEAVAGGRPTGSRATGGRPATLAHRERKRRAATGKAGGPPTKFSKKKPPVKPAQVLPERRIIGEALPAAQTRPAKFQPRSHQGAPGVKPTGRRPKRPGPQGAGRSKKRSGPR